MLGLAQLVLAVDDVDLHWLDGKQATAKWRGAASPGTLRLDFNGVPRDVPLAALERIAFHPVNREPADATEFLFAGGGRIRGQLGDRKPGAVMVQRRDGESLTIGFDKLVAVRLARAPVAPIEHQLWDRALSERLPGEDTLITHKGDSSKLLHGRLVDMGRDGGTFEFGGQERSFSLDKVYGVVLAEGVGRPAPPSVRVHLVDSTVFPGTITTADERWLTLQTSLGTLVSLSIEQIAEIEFLSDRITYLSQLTPIGQETKGLIHEPWPIRWDQTVTARPIRLSGKSYERGIGCHSYTRIDYALGGAYETLVATIGIDDYVRPRGSVVFRLNGDGAVLFDSGTLTGRSEAQAISVDVRGVDKLLLIVDYADAMDLSDHAVWAGARLIGPAASSGGNR